MTIKLSDIMPLPDKRSEKEHKRLVELVRERDRLIEQIRAEVSSLEDLLREWKD